MAKTTAELTTEECLRLDPSFWTDVDPRHWDGLDPEKLQAVRDHLTKQQIQQRIDHTLSIEALDVQLSRT